jgi:two-component system invasion response regulator UvrY
VYMGGRGITFNSTANSVRVMVVDDHPALRAGLRSLIDSDPALRVLLEVGSGEAAYAEYRTQRPDAVVMDLSMDGFGGIEAIRRIRALDPRAAILVYSVHNSQVLLERALEAGALGFVTKGSKVDTLLEGLKRVARGESFVSGDMLPALLDRHRPSAANQFKQLTQREFQSLQAAQRGPHAVRVREYPPPEQQDRQQPFHSDQGQARGGQSGRNGSNGDTAGPGRTLTSVAAAVAPVRAPAQRFWTCP